MKLNFNSTSEQRLQVANSCMGTPSKMAVFNENQPFPAPSVEALAMFTENKLLTATVFSSEGNQPAGFLFCGNFFPPHSDKIPHLAFGLGQDFTGSGYATGLLLDFIDHLRNNKLANQLYGHCYARNIGACRTMERAGMIGISIGIQPYSKGNEVMEYYIQL